MHPPFLGVTPLWTGRRVGTPSNRRGPSGSSPWVDHHDRQYQHHQHHHSRQRRQQSRHRHSDNNDTNTDVGSNSIYIDTVDINIGREVNPVSPGGIDRVPKPRPQDLLPRPSPDLTHTNCDLPSETRRGGPAFASDVRPEPSPRTLFVTAPTHGRPSGSRPTYKSGRPPSTRTLLVATPTHGHPSGHRPAYKSGRPPSPRTVLVATPTQGHPSRHRPPHKSGRDGHHRREQGTPV